MFSMQRLMLGLRNDMLRVSKMVLLTASVAFIVLLWFVLGAVKEHKDLLSLMYPIYGTVLIVGLMFSGVVWSDLQHPAGRIHYLMLPFSNLERFLGRWLLSGPLFLLFASAWFGIFQWVATLLASRMFDIDFQPFTLTSEDWLGAAKAFLWAQPLLFAGAIRFRKYSFLVSVIAYAVVVVVLVLAAILTTWVFVKLTNETGSILLPPAGPVRMIAGVRVSADWVYQFALVAWCWFMYLAWLLLQDREVQDGV